MVLFHEVVQVLAGSYLHRIGPAEVELVSHAHSSQCCMAWLEAIEGLSRNLRYQRTHRMITPSGNHRLQNNGFRPGFRFCIYLLWTACSKLQQNPFNAARSAARESTVGPESCAWEDTAANVKVKMRHVVRELPRAFEWRSASLSCCLLIEMAPIQISYGLKNCI